MKNLTVLGLGNRLMMDDGIGIYVVEEFKKKSDMQGFNFIVGETDVDYCLEVARKADFLVVIDAWIQNKNPGEVAVVDLKQLKRQKHPVFSGHDMHFLDKVFYFNKELEGIFIGIEPYQVDTYLGLSRLIQDKFSTIQHQVERVLRLIQRNGLNG